MPVDWSRYPDNWDEIAHKIKERAGWKCEWCERAHGETAIGRKGQPYRVVMTTAHLGVARPDGPGDKHDKMDCRDENLACLCQGCHLMYDLADHLEHAAVTRRKRRMELLQALYGNGFLFELNEESKEGTNENTIQDRRLDF